MGKPFTNTAQIHTQLTAFTPKPPLFLPLWGICLTLHSTSGNWTVYGKGAEGRVSERDLPHQLSKGERDVCFVCDLCVL
jgi:hypothetical protein